jgi:LmbE family N-acetylglucosaminyl deacetylase
MMSHLVVFSPHHADAYWQTSGLTIFLQECGWKVTYITVIGDHYAWGGGKETYRRRAVEAAERFGVDHILLDHKSMACSGADSAMAEEFCELVRDLEPTIAVTEYPIASHPDHQAVSINSLRALTKGWYGVPRTLPQEVWCYQGYNPYPTFDIAIDVGSVRDQVRERICFWDEFGEGEGNSLWQNRQACGLRENFTLMQADPTCFTIAKDLLGERFSFHANRLARDLLF